MHELQAILRQLEQNSASPRALATLVSVEGSSYRRVGARLLIDAEGASLGSISGGCLESDVIERAREVIQNGQPQVAVYNTADENDLVWGTGTGCDGVVRILIERLPPHPMWAKRLRENLAARQTTQLKVVWEAPGSAGLGTHGVADLPKRLPAKTKVFLDEVVPPVRLLVFGAGDDAHPMVSLARKIGWWVELADARPARASSFRFPEADKVTILQPSEAGCLAFDPWTVAVIMTHRYYDDLEILRLLLPKELPYLGLLGPKTRAKRMLKELKAANVKISAKMLTKLHAPVGLDLGGDGPAAVALAVLSEIQAVMSGRNARPLRERNRPIHA